MIPKIQSAGSAMSFEQAVSTKKRQWKYLLDTLPSTAMSTPTYPTTGELNNILAELDNLADQEAGEQRQRNQDKKGRQAEKKKAEGSAKQVARLADGRAVLPRMANPNLKRQG